MILNYKYRLYPNITQKNLLDQQFFAANQSWNYTLRLKSKDVSVKKGFTKRKMIELYVRKQLKIRGITANSGIIQNSIINMEKTFIRYFLMKKKGQEVGFPDFKTSSNIQQSFEFKPQGIQITEKYFKIMKMKIKWKYNRELPSKPKKIIIKREADGNYFVIFSVEIEKENLPKTGKTCGIDLNIQNIALATSTGKTFLKTIVKLSKYSKKYQKLQKVLSRRYEKAKKSKQKVSKNTKKLQKKQNKIHKKVKNIKEDFFHKTSSDIVKNFDHIRVEKLEVKEMKEKAPSKRLRRDIAEVSWTSLIEKLRYKSERYGRVFEEINPAYTSQRCNVCGFISKKNRTSQSIFCCKKCGNKDNADCNAAKNILEYETWFLEQKTRWASRHAESSITS